MRMTISARKSQPSQREMVRIRELITLSRRPDCGHSLSGDIADQRRLGRRAGAVLQRVRVQSAGDDERAMSGMRVGNRPDGRGAEPVAVELSGARDRALAGVLAN